MESNMAQEKEQITINENENVTKLMRDTGLSDDVKNGERWKLGARNLEKERSRRRRRRRKRRRRIRIRLRKNLPLND
jgi:hypothetical protein